MNGIEAEELKKKWFNQKVFPQEVLEWIAKENLWKLWVPKEYGGLESSLQEGIEQLQTLARIDGSLGWTVTLCSGANYFIGNLQPLATQDIFLSTDAPVCLGGSGGVFGTAEKQGDFYRISGTWKYATGANYLSHFTLNAHITESNQKCFHQDGTPLIRSFVVPKEDVEIIPDWDSMGLQATVTHSFVVKEKLIDERYSFHYDETFLPHSIFKIPFGIFTDLTLWVNYIGMAEHFIEKASRSLTSEDLEAFEKHVSVSNADVNFFCQDVETKIKNNQNLSADYPHKLHKTAAKSIGGISQMIIQIFPRLGMKASRDGDPLNSIFKDYFTATQHRNFSS